MRVQCYVCVNVLLCCAILFNICYAVSLLCMLSLLSVCFRWLYLMHWYVIIYILCIILYVFHFVDILVYMASFCLIPCHVILHHMTKWLFIDVIMLHILLLLYIYLPYLIKIIMIRLYVTLCYFMSGLVVVHRKGVWVCLGSIMGVILVVDLVVAAAVASIRLAVRIQAFLADHLAVSI